MRLILGSGSPRRRELLGVLGYAVADIRRPEIDETPQKAEPPRAYVNRIARAKAEALPPAFDEVILCADTTVAAGRRILGKPQDEAEARAFLEVLSGRRHKVFTALVVRTQNKMWQCDVVSRVRMKRLSAEEIAGYLASQDWRGQAGGYAIQGPAGAFIPWISGSYSSIMGLPLAQTNDLLRAAGVFPVTGPPRTAHLF